jgi:hypothetical protein
MLATVGITQNSGAIPLPARTCSDAGRVKALYPGYIVLSRHADLHSSFYWGRDYRTCLAYVKQNELEALGFVEYTPRKDRYAKWYAETMGSPPAQSTVHTRGPQLSHG